MLEHLDNLFEKVSSVKASNVYKKSPMRFKHLDHNGSQSTWGHVGLSNIVKTWTFSYSQEATWTTNFWNLLIVVSFTKHTRYLIENTFLLERMVRLHCFHCSFTWYTKLMLSIFYLFLVKEGLLLRKCCQKSLLSLCNFHQPTTWFCLYVLICQYINSVCGPYTRLMYSVSAFALMLRYFEVVSIALNDFKTYDLRK